jgi:hypothetical protein
MQSSIRKALAALAFGGVVILTSGMTAAGQQQDQSSKRGSLEGTWITQVTQRNCQTGAAIAVPFLSSASFARGGTMTETTSSPAFYPAERGPGHGVWSHTGGQNYRASSIAFITVQGVLAKIQVITQTIVLDTDRDTFETPKATVQFFKPDGTLAGSGCATAVSWRFE